MKRCDTEESKILGNVWRKSAFVKRVELLFGDKKFSVSAVYKEILSTWHDDSTRKTASTTS